MTPSPKMTRLNQVGVSYEPLPAMLPSASSAAKMTASALMVRVSVGTAYGMPLPPGTPLGYVTEMSAPERLDATFERETVIPPATLKSGDSDTWKRWTPSHPFMVNRTLRSVTIVICADMRHGPVEA